MSDALKPCPFCGSEPVNHAAIGMVRCSDANCVCGQRWAFDVKWNTRATDDKVQALVEILETITDRAEFATMQQDDKFNFRWMVEKSRAALEQFNPTRKETL